MKKIVTSFASVAMALVLFLPTIVHAGGIPISFSSVMYFDEVYFDVGAKKWANFDNFYAPVPINLENLKYTASMKKQILYKPSWSRKWRPKYQRQRLTYYLNDDKLIERALFVCEVKNNSMGNAIDKASKQYMLKNSQRFAKGIYKNKIFIKKGKTLYVCISYGTKKFNGNVNSYFRKYLRV